MTITGKKLETVPNDMFQSNSAYLGHLKYVEHLVVWSRVWVIPFLPEGTALKTLLLEDCQWYRTEWDNDAMAREIASCPGARLAVCERV